MVRFFLAAFAAFLMFLRAALLCFCVFVLSSLLGLLEGSNRAERSGGRLTSAEDRCSTRKNVWDLLGSAGAPILVRLQADRT